MFCKKSCKKHHRSSQMLELVCTVVTYLEFVQNFSTLWLRRKKVNIPVTSVISQTESVANFNQITQDSTKTYLWTKVAFRRSWLLSAKWTHCPVCITVVVSGTYSVVFFARSNGVFARWIVKALNGVKRFLDWYSRLLQSIEWTRIGI